MHLHQPSAARLRATHPLRRKLVSALAALCFAAASNGQQTAAPATAAPASGTASSAKLLEIWQIDLDPSGTAFALGKPVLDGDAYVFKAWPENTAARLPQSKVKKISQRTKNLDQEVVYRIDLLLSGRMIARENPTLKGTTYTFHTWKDNALMSLRKTDIRQS